MNTHIKPLSIFYFFLGAIACFSSHAQDRSGKTITPYKTIYSDSRGTVQMRFLLFPCSNTLSTRQYGFYNTIDDKGGYVSGKFDYVECDGKIGTEKFNVSLSRTGEIKDGGDWFGSNPYQIVKVYDVKRWGGSFGNGSSSNSGNTGNGSGSYSSVGNGSGTYWNSGRSGSAAYNNGNSGNGNGSYSNSNGNGNSSYSNGNGGSYGNGQQYGTAITLYTDGNFSGLKKTISGDWSVSGMGDSWNDSISSMRIPAGWKVTVYKDINFQGRSMDITGDWSVSGQFDEWNDQISSIRVTRQ